MLTLTHKPQCTQAQAAHSFLSHSLFLSFQHGTYSYRLDPIIKRTRGLELGLKHPTPFWPQESTPHQPASSLSACRRPACGRREGGGVISRRGDDDAAPSFRLSSEADHGVQKILVLGSAGTGSANSGTVHGHEPVESSHSQAGDVMVAVHVVRAEGTKENRSVPCSPRPDNCSCLARQRGSDSFVSRDHMRLGARDSDLPHWHRIGREMTGQDAV